MTQPEGTFRQYVSVVRHGHRRDQEPGNSWKTSDDAKKHPYDSPLTAKGKEAANQVAQRMKSIQTEARWDVVITSPYIRCVQTAAEIAAVCNLPLILDSEFGEVFDEVYMPRCKGDLQHRRPEAIRKILQREYPTVEILSTDNVPRLFGTQPAWPESFSSAQVRFLERFESTCIKGVEKASSSIIVSHGDAVLILLALLQPRLQVKKIDYCGFFSCWRDTRLPDKTDETWKENLWDNCDQNSLYQDNWKVTVGSGVTYSQKEDTLTTQIESTAMQDHAKEHVDKYRRQVKTERNMWTMTPEKSNKAKAAAGKLNDEGKKGKNAPLLVLDEGSADPLKDEEERNSVVAPAPRRRDKKALTATANLVKMKQQELQNLARMGDE